MITITKKINLYKFEELGINSQYTASDEMLERYGDAEILVDDCVLIEFGQKEIDKRIKENKAVAKFYEKNDILLKNNRNIYFDLYKNYIDLSKATEIKDISVFLAFIGIENNEEEYLQIYNIEFSSNGEVYFERYAQTEKEEEEQEKLIKIIHEKIEEIENSVYSRIEKEYEYIQTESFANEMELYFTECGKIYDLDK